jgi:lysophospholipase L1-like esterase
MNVYNPFVAEDTKAGNFEKLTPYLDQVNEYIASSSTRNGIPVADIHAAFNGPVGNEDAVEKGLIAIDGIHPNDQGHAVIADSLRSLRYAPLAK